jgi:hypothetical protein
MWKKSTDRLPCNSKKYPNGTRVIGIRQGAVNHGMHGVVIEAYYTVNRWNGYIFRNQAFVVLCDDGKERVYQYLHLEEGDNRAFIPNE